MGVAAVCATHAQQPANPADGADRIVALDPRWTVEFATPPASAAGFDARAAYVPLKNGDLVAVSLDDGTVQWRVPLKAGATPATGDGLIFAAADSVIHALDQTSGALLWQIDLQQVLAAPLHWDAGWLFASTQGGDLFAIDAQDGKIVWHNPLGFPLVAAPSPAGDLLFVALRDGRILGLSLETGAMVWSLPLSEEVSGLLALDDQLLVGTRANRLHSLSTSRGRVRWTQRAGADVAGIPAADDDRIYFVAMDNLVRALDRNSGSIEWTRAISSRPAGGPLLTGDVVLVPLVTSEIHAFQTTSGQPAFTITVAGEPGGLPFLRDTSRPTAPRLIAISRDGKLQGFGSRFDPVPALLPGLPGIKITG
jgi:outer membrane protein assembly factor BamB